MIHARTEILRLWLFGGHPDSPMQCFTNAYKWVQKNSCCAFIELKKGRNWCWSYRGVLLMDLFFMVCSACCFINSRTTNPRSVHTMEWVLVHSLLRENSTGLSTANPYRGNFSIVFPSPQMIRTMPSCHWHKTRQHNGIWSMCQQIWLCLCINWFQGRLISYALIKIVHFTFHNQKTTQFYSFVTYGCALV